MRTSIIKQVLFSVFCAGFGWYLSAWWADISHKPFAFFTFGFVVLFLPVLSLVYIGIRKSAVRRAYVGLLALHYLLLAGWIFSVSGQTMPADHYLMIVIFVGYVMAQIGAWYALYRGVPKLRKCEDA